MHHVVEIFWWGAERETWHFPDYRSALQFVNAIQAHAGFETVSRHRDFLTFRSPRCAHNQAYLLQRDTVVFLQEKGRLWRLAEPLHGRPVADVAVA